mmetsp:Transcript_66606/g.145210  ORF Transcript_66606/g.145210 Transcript_66606/m.145210 type:complete len:214 (-) Transcript_66606:1130-1771(-)
MPMPLPTFFAFSVMLELPTFLQMTVSGSKGAGWRVIALPLKVKPSDFCTAAFRELSVSKTMKAMSALHKSLRTSSKSTPSRGLWTGPSAVPGSAAFRFPAECRFFLIILWTEGCKKVRSIFWKSHRTPALDSFRSGLIGGTLEEERRFLERPPLAPPCSRSSKSSCMTLDMSSSCSSKSQATETPTTFSPVASATLVLSSSSMCSEPLSGGRP